LLQHLYLALFAMGDIFSWHCTVFE